MQAEALAVRYLVPEFRIFLIHDKECVQIALVCIGIAVADIAGAFFLSHPDADRILALGVPAELVFQGGFAGREVLKLLLQLSVYLHIMGLQDPGVTKRIAVVEHFLEMRPAEAGVVGLLADIALHIGGTGTEDEIQQILFHIAFDEAERAFVAGVHGVVQRDGVQFLFHEKYLLSRWCSEFIIRIE